jgi:hypothetical protein
MSATNKEKVHKILDQVDGDIDLAAENVYASPKALIIYVITIGLEHIKAKRRANRRRELRREVEPEFRPGRTSGSVEFTPQFKKKLLEKTQKLFGKDGWDIGEINLGSFTKEGLISMADSERKSAKGHIQNAQFYETLAEPLKPGQMVKDFWKPEAASKIKKEIWKKGEGRKADLV